MSSINLDASNAMAAFVLKAKSAIQDVTKMAIIEVGNRLIDRSPVGDPSTWKRQPAWVSHNYIPGRFKNNWQLGIDEIPQSVFFVSDPSGEYAKARIAAAMPRWSVGKTFYFVNNLPYASALENGHSGQAPNGMVSLTKMEFQNIVRESEIAYSAGARPAKKS